MIKLSDIQREIVYSDAKNIIVDAGAGAGKTRTLTERVKYILETGADPRGIVVITFTTDAADELKERLHDVKGINDCFVGTIHAYANRLLKKTGMQFEIFSEVEQTEYMNYLIPKYAKYCTIEDYFIFLKYDRLAESGKISKSEIKNKFTSDKVYSEIMQLLGREYSSYYKETVKTLCKLNNVITFDELIELSTKHFDESNTKLEYLFVDELQDVGYLEYGFLKSLNAENNFYIGDDYQSIYGFKGGCVQIFISLMNDPSWTHYYLTENYRTASSILKYANMIIKNAEDIVNKDVVCMNENKGSLEFISKNQLNAFAGKLNEKDDWLILTRSNKDMMMLSGVLKKDNISHICTKRSENNSDFNKIKSKKCIKLMTVHASKGLEAENVLLYGKFPIKGTGKSDEIKVFYVGLTRAKNRCVVFV